MKKLIILSSFAIALIAACSSNSSDTGNDTTPVESQTNNGTGSLADTIGNTQETSAQFAKGKDLITGMDCVGCHKEYDRIVGPSYSEVAKKYEANDENIAMLSKKIIEGGNGNWGEIPMTAHPNLSKEDAAEMVKYILSLK